MQVQDDESKTDTALTLGVIAVGGALIVASAYVTSSGSPPTGLALAALDLILIKLASEFLL